MDYPKMRELLSDNQYIAELLNCFADQRSNAKLQPICSEWIREKASDEVTRAYQLLSAQDGTLVNKVIVVQNPSIPEDAACIENQSDCPRYILLTVIPDVPLAYELNLPVLQTMGVLALSSWEISRATARACRHMNRVSIRNEAVPPILNKADVEWISLYVGRKPFEGGDNIRSNYVADDEVDFDIHLYRLREMEDNPVIERMIHAYEVDCARRGEFDNTAGESGIYR